MLLPIAFMGCKSDDDESWSDANPMTIALQVTTDQAQTRGEVITPETFPQAGRKFRIWGWMSEGGNSYPMNSEWNEHGALQAVDVFYRSDRPTPEWTADDTYFWPIPRFRADFYGIYPADQTSAPFDAETKTITYTDFDGNTDLMYATYSDQRPKKDVLEKQRMAYMYFYHAMSQIRFVGKLSAEFADDFQYKVQVKSIKLCNVCKAATLTFNASVNEIGENPGKATAMTMSAISSPGKYDIPMNAEGDNYPIVDSKTESIALSSPSDVRMVIPQTLTAWDPTVENTGTAHPSTSNGYLAIELRIISGDADTPVYPLGSTDKYITVYAPFNSGTHEGWKPGVAYTYELTLGAGYSAGGNPVIQPITIEAAITPWQKNEVAGTAKH